MKPYIEEVNKATEKERIDIILNKFERKDLMQRSKCSFIINRKKIVVKLRMLKMAEILAANYEKLSLVANAKEIEWWISRHIHYFKHRADSINGLSDYLLLREEMRSVSNAMLKAAKSAGLDEIGRRLEKFYELLKEDNDIIRFSKIDYDVRVMNKLPVLLRSLFFISLNKVRGDIGLEEEALNPSRYVDHAIAGRVFSSIAWFLFGLILLAAWSCRFMRKSSMTPLSARLRSGLSSFDWMLIVGLGVLFPVTFYWSLSHLTSLSAREWSIDTVSGTLLFGQFYALFLAIITMSLSVIAWRLNKVYHLGNRKNNLLSWGMTLGSFLVMIIAGLLDERLGLMYHLMWGLIGIITIYLLSLATRFFIKPPHITSYTVNRTLTPVLAVSMLIMTLMTACFYEVEKHYIAKDTLLSIDPKTGDINFVSMITKQGIKELKERVNILNLDSEEPESE